MNKKIGVALIEDEELARELIKKFMRSFDNLELLCECDNGFEAVKELNRIRPELVFLDIQIPKINGFELLELLDYEPELVFTTAYNEYAIKAFEVNAIDYLLKPFTLERFEQAVQKAIAKLSENQSMPTKLKPELHPAALTEEEYLLRVVIKDRSNIHVVDVATINWMEAQDDYVMIYTSKGKFLKQQTLSYFENNLNPNDFCRVHRSFLIRLDQITKLELYAKESYYLYLKDGSKVKVSKNRYKQLKELLNI